jgi:hypothetical protein
MKKEKRKRKEKEKGSWHSMHEKNHKIPLYHSD